MKNLSTTGRYILRVFAAVLFAVGALSLAATGANASHLGTGNKVGPDVTPEFRAETANIECKDLSRDGQTWLQIKVDPNGDGVYDNDPADPADRVAVEVAHTTNDKTFDWALVDGEDIVGGIDAVFVKAGAGGSNLYRYDDPEADPNFGETLADDGLTSPGDSGNAISHISFCYDEGGGPTTTTTEETTTTVEETTTTVEETTTTVEETTTTVGETPTTAGEVQSTVAERETEVAGVQVTQPPAPQVESGQLARTGMSDWLAPFGVFLIAMGVGALRLSRAPKPAQVIAR